MKLFRDVIAYSIISLIVLCAIGVVGFVVYSEWFLCSLLVLAVLLGLVINWAFYTVFEGVD